jgi:diphthine-ammonia ligase
MPAGPRAAVAWSGGKDSTLALHRAVSDGTDVRVLLNFYDAGSGRVRFHGVRAELIAAQASALGLELVQLPTTMQDFEGVFTGALQALRARGVEALVFGNINLADVRGWYERRTVAAGLKHIEPLWGCDPTEVVQELIDAGYSAVLTGIDASRVPRAWLGREIDAGLLASLRRLHDIDVAGERGEYHSFVRDGPLFRAPVDVLRGEERDDEPYALLDLALPADAGVNRAARG